MTHAHLVLCMALAVLVTALGCGDGTDVPGLPQDTAVDFTDTASGTGSETDSDSVSGNPASALVGHYVERVTVSTLDTIPGVGEKASTSQYWGLTEVYEEDGKILASSVSCRSDVGGGSGVEVIISDELTQLIPPLVGEVTAQEVEGDTVFSREVVYMPLGVVLDDPVNDLLPTSAADPRIFDQDEDGKPGVTIVLSMFGMKGEIYAVRKEVGSWSVSEQEDGSYNGPFRDASLQKVIGANPAMFKVDPKSRPNPDESKSALDLVRTQDKYDCDRLIAELDTLFP